MRFKYFTCLFILLLLGQFQGTAAQSILFPHIVEGAFLNPDGSVPAAGEIVYQAYLSRSPYDITDPQGCLADGKWMVELVFQEKISQAGWKPGDTLVVVYENVLAASPFYGAKKTLNFATSDESPESVGSVSLPVELTTFTAAVKNSAISDVVVLEWRTVGETNNLGFDVERSLDGKTFEKLGFVPGAGSTNLARAYGFTDNKVEVNTYFYRLKQIDRNGASTYSDVREVEVAAPQYYELTQNFPNPFNPRTDIVFRVQHEGLVSLKVYDLLGREVQTLVNEKRAAGIHRVSFDARELPSGIYLYSITMGTFHDVKKMLLVK